MIHHSRYWANIFKILSKCTNGSNCVDGGAHMKVSWLMSSFIFYSFEAASCSHPGTNGILARLGVSRLQITPISAPRACYKIAGIPTQALMIALGHYFGSINGDFVQSDLVQDSAVHITSSLTSLHSHQSYLSFFHGWSGSEKVRNQMPESCNTTKESPFPGCLIKRSGTT